MSVCWLPLCQVSEQSACELSAEEMSQLNPNAAEFVPVSPTRNMASPTYLVDDKLIAQSPRRALPMDIDLPSPGDFQSEVKQRPSEVREEADNRDTQNVSFYTCFNTKAGGLFQLKYGVRQKIFGEC